QGAALEKDGNKDGAAEAYQRAATEWDAANKAYQTATDSILAELSAEKASPTPGSDNAASLQYFGLVAGSYLAEHGSLDRAVTAYDQVVAITDAHAANGHSQSTESLLNGERDALLGKATVCQRLGGCGD